MTHDFEHLEVVKTRRSQEICTFPQVKSDDTTKDYDVNGDHEERVEIKAAVCLYVFALN